jgi:hypothetical protein
MTAVRLVQAGNGAARDVVLVYHLASAVDAAVRAAAGPAAVIGNQTFAGDETIGKLLRVSDAVSDLQAQAGPFDVRRVVLVGFSRGCQGVRANLGPLVSMAVAVDGIHAPKANPGPALAPWQTFGEFARQGAARLIVTHTAIEPGKYLSTTETADRLWPEAKAAAEPAPGGGKRWRSGGLEVWSYPGSDTAAHIYQGQHVLPAALAELLGGSSSSPPGPTPKPTPKPTPPAASSSSSSGGGLGLLALAFGFFSFLRRHRR